MSEHRTNPLLLQVASILTGIIAIVAIAFSKFTSGKLILLVVGLALVAFIASLALEIAKEPIPVKRVTGMPRQMGLERNREGGRGKRLWVLPRRTLERSLQAYGLSMGPERVPPGG